MNAELAHRPSDRTFLTLAEFASMIGIGSTVAYELAQQNKLPIPVFRIGRQYRVSRIAYEAMLTAKHQSPDQSDEVA